MGSRPQHTPAYRRFCRLLRTWRQEAGMTQRQLAAALRRPASWVHKSETAERRVDPLELIAWARATGVEPAEAIRAVERVL